MEVRPGTMYRVEITEYDSGAQRVYPNDTKIFTTYEEALAYKDHWETGGHWETAGRYECYWRAHITKIC